MIQLAYVIIAGALGAASWWINGVIFQPLEVASGINLVYWPHGVRVLMVLLFGFPGALGLTISAFWVAPIVYSEDPWLSTFTPLVSGFAPYVARRLLLVETSGEASNLAGLSSERLISIVTLSALFNAGGHILLRFSVKDGGNYPAEFCAMLVGDLLGALSLLYGIKFIGVSYDRFRGMS